ncbi:MAG: hypothetical protein ACFFAO_06730 [Candidatus Hermodarchaeota archaeon]
MSDELEMIKFVAMIISIIGFVNFPIIVKRRKNFKKFLPGITCLILLFTSSFLEDAFRIFEILKNIFVLAGAILLFIAVRIEFKKMRLTKEELLNINNRTEKGD